MKTTITQNEGLPGRPISFVQSHSRSRHFATINVGAKEQEAEDVQTFSCTTLAIQSETTLNANDVFGALYANGLYGDIAATELCGIAAALHIGSYDSLCATLIAGRYSYAEELAAHRKALLGDTEELAELTAFAEECKAKAKAAFACDGKQE